MYSASQQRAKLQVLIGVDENNNGAAATRNQLIEQAAGDYVVFLDADDLLSVDYVSACLALIQPMGYVYTDHYEGQAQTVKQCHYDNIAPWKIEHYITTLMPIDMARLMFDVTLPCMEDVEFYLRARKQGFKPMYYPRPLWFYRHEYGVGRANRRDPKMMAQAIKQGEGILRERYE